MAHLTSEEILNHIRMKPGTEFSYTQKAVDKFFNRYEDDKEARTKDVLIISAFREVPHTPIKTYKVEFFSRGDGNNTRVVYLDTAGKGIHTGTPIFRLADSEVAYIDSRVTNNHGRETCFKCHGPVKVSVVIMDKYYCCPVCKV